MWYWRPALTPDDLAGTWSMRCRPSLEWADGLLVSGALAELELGPIARNIAGARAAGERLVRTT
jgi:hypothetical protein